MVCRCPEPSRASIGRGCDSCLKRAAADRRRVRTEKRRATVVESGKDRKRKHCAAKRTGIDSAALQRAENVSDGGDDYDAGNVAGEPEQSTWSVGKVPSGVTDRAFGRCTEMLSSDYMEERICCLCDGLYPFRNMVVKTLSRCKSHTIHHRSTEAVVTVFSSRLPDIRRHDEQVKLNYCKRPLALFMPFRLPNTFVDADESVTMMFDTWWTTSAADLARRYAACSEDYYVARDVADARADDDLVHYENCATSDPRNMEAVDPSSNEASDNECDPSSMLDGIEWNGGNVEYVEALPKGIDATKHVASAMLCTESVECSMNMTELDEEIQKREVLAQRTQEEPNARDSSGMLRDQPDVPTRIEVLSAVDGSEHWEPSVDQPSTDLPERPTLMEISRLFKLNEKQHKMFVTAGKRLLELDDSEVSRESLVSFLGGQPGAGKSQVIRALQEPAASWNSSDVVGTVSFQGVAAQSVNGETIHKFFGWGLRGFSKTQPVSLELREKIIKLRLLIVDEVSTTDVKFIGMIDSCLRHIRNKPDLLFGGVDVLFVGDWLQQLPVAGVPAYVDEPPFRARRSRGEHGEYFFRSRGIQGYRQISNVVMLTENMRHRDDPEWRDILGRWRTGNFTEADIVKVNAAGHDASWEDRNSEQTSFCPIIVTSNALRCQFNSQSLRAYCETHGVVLHRFLAKLSSSRKKKVLEVDLQKRLRNIRDDKTGSMPIVLEIALGTPVQCTKNASRALKLANGSIGVVAGFVVSDTDATNSITHETYEEVMHSAPPEAVFVKLRGYEHVQFVSFLPVGVVPVRLRLEKSVNVVLPHRSFNICISQVPLTPAFSITTEKCQGMTLEKMMLAPLQHCTRCSPQKSSFYVATTRAKSLRQLYLMEELSLNKLKYFSAVPAAMKETQRLERLEAE